MSFGLSLLKFRSWNRYHQRAPTSWTAITTAFLFFVIGLLVGYILYGAASHIVKVEDDFHEMQELKVRAEAADVAKSQVFLTLFHKAHSSLVHSPQHSALTGVLIEFLAPVSCHCLS